MPGRDPLPARWSPLDAVFRFPDGLRTWPAGYREPPEAARRTSAAFYLDALDECRTDSERRACYDAASEVLQAIVRPVARPAVTPVRVVSPDPVRYQTGFGISVIGRPGFLVSEVTCRCQRRY